MCSMELRALASVDRVVHDGAIHRVCPIDLRSLPPVPVSGPQQVRDAVDRARVAQAAWCRRPLKERVAALERAARRMLENRDEALELLSREIGKNDVDALFSEALGPLDAVRAWARVVRAATRRKVRLNPFAFPRKQAEVELVARGVIGVIAPWNYPIAGLYRSVFPALLTGNAVVLKPSEYAPRSSEWFIRQLAAELPDALVAVVHGDGATGRRLIDAGIDACVFTGSVRAGAEVRKQCAELGIPSSIEMGGNDPAIVLADCDLERTIAGITHWALHNAGQACGAVELVYVDQRIADRFVVKMGQSWCRLRVGARDADVAPLANPAQLETVERHVADALAKGARLVCGGRRTGEGLGYLPTVLDHCTDAMDVVREETFGPVVAIVRVDGAGEAILRTNAGRYGLGVSIWTRDVARARRLAERLDVGVINVNNHSMTGAVAALPWSGTRATGYGVANSEWSLLTFTRPRALLVDRSKGPEPFWMPYDGGLGALGHLLSDAQIGRLRGAWRIPLLLHRRVRAVKRFFRG